MLTYFRWESASINLKPLVKAKISDCVFVVWPKIRISSTFLLLFDVLAARNFFCSVNCFIFQRWMGQLAVSLIYVVWYYNVIFSRWIMLYFKCPSCSFHICKILSYSGDVQTNCCCCSRGLLMPKHPRNQEAY